MKFFQKSMYQYTPLGMQTSSSSFDQERFIFEDEKSNVKPSKLGKYFEIARSISCHLQFFVPLLLLVSILWVASYSLKPKTLQECLKHTNAYSPAFEAVQLYDTQFSNAFNKRDEYIGPPTPEREEAWFKLWNQAEVLIPKKEMIKLNVSRDMLDMYLKAPEGEGTGYVGGLEVFHQLHCLNYVRQFTWYLMEKYTDETLPEGFTNPLKTLRIHADHCIETLRLALMCHSDTTPVLVKMDDYYDPPRPQADFNAFHRCRDFDKIMEWNEKNGLSTFGDANHHTDHSV